MDVKRELAAIPATMKKAVGVSRDEAITGVLVALPFSGAFGIWVNALTWWPNGVTLTLTALVALALALWIMGHSRAGETE